MSAAAAEEAKEGPSSRPLAAAAARWASRISAGREGTARRGLVGDGEGQTLQPGRFGAAGCSSEVMSRPGGARLLRVRRRRD